MPILGEIKGRYVILDEVNVGQDTEIHNFVTIRKTNIGKNNQIWNFVNIYDSEIGDDNTIASFCEIGGSKIGSNCKIEAMAFIPKGVTIGNHVFIGPAVRFANDKYPTVVDDKWEWKVGTVRVEDNASIGIGSIILPNVTIGEHAFVAAGALVTTNVPPRSFAMGHPAHIVTRETAKELRIL